MKIICISNTYNLHKEKSVADVQVVGEDTRPWQHEKRKMNWAAFRIELIKPNLTK